MERAAGWVCGCTDRNRKRINTLLRLLGCPLESVIVADERTLQKLESIIILCMKLWMQYFCPHTVNSTHMWNAFTAHLLLCWEIMKPYLKKTFYFFKERFFSLIELCSFRFVSGLLCLWSSAVQFGLNVVLFPGRVEVRWSKTQSKPPLFSCHCKCTSHQSSCVCLPDAPPAYSLHSGGTKALVEVEGQRRVTQWPSQAGKTGSSIRYQWF